MPTERSEQELRRREEREALEDAGISPYAYSWNVSHHAAGILDGFDEDKHQPGDDGEAAEPLTVSIAVGLWMRSDAGRALFQRVVLRVPVAGKAILMVALTPDHVASDHGQGLLLSYPG